MQWRDYKLVQASSAEQLEERVSKILYRSPDAGDWRPLGGVAVVCLDDEAWFYQALIMRRR